MIKISISEISKNPALFDSLDEIVEVMNKKTRTVKGFFVPASYSEHFRKILEEMDYQHFKNRNRSLQSEDSLEDDTLEDGLDDV